MKSNINFSYLIFLSVVAALGGFLFGYDAAVISGTISQVTVKFGLDEIQIGWFVQVLAVHLVTLWNNWCLHVCWEV